ncbi:MAG: MmgE/PrpD family protein [Hyphomicrobiaceae bacterium]
MAAPGTQAAFASYIADSRKRNIPDAIIDAARLCLADWMAVAIGAGDEPAGRVVRKTVASWQSKGRSHVLFGGTAAPALAALANGTLAHCLDFDDTHVGAITHTSAPVWAATLALGEERQASEHDMLRAFITGFEVATRAQSGGLGQKEGDGARLAFDGDLGPHWRGAASALLELDAARASNFPWRRCNPSRWPDSVFRHHGKAVSRWKSSDGRHSRSRACR